MTQQHQSSAPGASKQQHPSTNPFPRLRHEAAPSNKTKSNEHNSETHLCITIRRGGAPGGAAAVRAAQVDLEPARGLVAAAESRGWSWC